MEPLSGAELLRKIKDVEAYVNKHKSTVPDRLYTAMDGMSRVGLAYLNANGAPGWALKAKNEEGEPIWTKKEADALEELVSEKVKTYKEIQKGGAIVKPPGPELHVTPASSLVTLPVASTFSIDEIFENIRDYVATIDTKNRELASILGPVAIVKSMSEDYTKDIEIPMLTPLYPFIKNVPVPPRMVIPLINSVLETCRLMVSTGNLDIEILRKLLSFVLAIFDITRGEWKNGLFSFMGFFGKETMVLGQSLKTARWIYNFISPDIQRRIEDDIFAGGKSIIAGSILWFVSIVSPGIVQRIVNNMVAVAKQPVDELNKKFEEIQKVSQASASKIGATVTFPKFPLAQFPSFDDVQNFQSIVHQPEVFCSKQFQSAFASAIEVPVLRILFEMMNVPTTLEKVAETCRGQEASIEESLMKSMLPTVTMDEKKDTSQVGGIRVCTPDATPRNIGALAGVKATTNATIQRLREIDGVPQEPPSPTLANRVANTVLPVATLGANTVKLGSNGAKIVGNVVASTEDVIADVDNSTANVLDGTSCLIQSSSNTLKPIVSKATNAVSNSASSASESASSAISPFIKPVVSLVTEVAKPVVNSVLSEAGNTIPAVVNAGKQISESASSIKQNVSNSSEIIYEKGIQPISKETIKSTQEAIEFATPIAKKAGNNLSKSTNKLSELSSNVEEIVVEPVIQKVKERSGNATVSINAAKASLASYNATTGPALKNKTMKLRNKTGKLGSSAYRLGKTVKSLFSSSSPSSPSSPSS